MDERVKPRSHIPTRLNSWVGSLSVGIWDRGSQQQLGPFVRLIRRVVNLEMFQINDWIVGSIYGSVNARSHIPTQLNSGIGLQPVGICDRALRLKCVPYLL